MSTIDSTAFRGLSSLQFLDLSYNNLSCINAAVFTGLGGLRELRLNDNKLASFNFTTFTSLAFFDKINVCNNPGNFPSCNSWAFIQYQASQLSKPCSSQITTEKFI
jgi:Leucine-rich repeat (LRR) protein